MINQSVQREKRYEIREIQTRAFMCLVNYTDNLDFNQRAIRRASVRSNWNFKN